MTAKAETSLKRIETELLPYVEKPMRYVGNELHCVRKDLTKVSVRGVLCFPDIYDIGMSHYGLQILYHIVNRHESWAASRCFHPARDAEPVMREKKIPLFCLEYGLPLKTADWIGFSLQYELLYTGLVNMLDLGGVPVWAADRTESDPIVLAGGPCVGNPEPIADFVDAVVVGDGERALEEICAVLEMRKQRALSRKETLAALGGISGVYVPSLASTSEVGGFVVSHMPGDTPVRAAKIPALLALDYPSKPLVPLIDVVHHRLAVEVMRGCTRGCRFCSAGMYYRPVRERAAAELHAEMAAGISETGWHDVSLLSLSTADYSGLDALLGAAVELKKSGSVAVSLPSTRIDSLTDAQLATLNSIYPSSSMTIAPEAASQRLRNVINKDFTNDQIMASVSLLLRHGMQTIKLYFMIGLPTETDADIDAMIGMIGAIADKARGASRRVMINVSLSPFSPKASTPFQWEAMESKDVLMSKGRKVKKALESFRNVKLSYRDSDVTFLETVMARGDRAVAKVVYRAWQLGARLDAWEEHLATDLWRQAAVEVGNDLHRYTAAIPLDAPLPWGCIDTGVSQAFLRAERDRAYAELATGDCRGDDCSTCGVCGELQPHFVEKEPVQATQSIVSRRPRPGEGHVAVPQFTYRVRYVKGEAVRFLGHRDLTSVITRAMVAAGVPLAYSEGYHPHPRLSFGPPLSLSVAGSGELIDVYTVSAWDCDVAAVNRYLPDGLAFEDVRLLAGKPAAIQAAMVAARYRFEPLHAELAAEAAAAVAGFVAAESVVVHSERKSGPIDKNLKLMVSNLTVVEPDAGVFDALLALEPSNTCTPADLIAGLFPGRRIYDFLITRTVSFCTEGGVLKPM